MEEDEILVTYIYKEDEQQFISLMMEHDCYDSTALSRHGNIRLVDVAIGEDVIYSFNKSSDNGVQNGMGFNKTKKGSQKLKFCFSTAFQEVSETEALSWV